jgi:hypothetical protein
MRYFRTYSRVPFRCEIEFVMAALAGRGMEIPADHPMPGGSRSAVIVTGRHYRFA